SSIRDARFGRIRHSASPATKYGYLHPVSGSATGQTYCESGFRWFASLPDPHPAGVVHSLQENSNSLRRKIFIDRSTTTLPMSVVVDNQYSAWNQSRKKMFQFTSGRFVPVCVQSQQRDRPRVGVAQRFFNRS